MTYLELELENKKLKEILTKGLLEYPDSDHSFNCKSRTPSCSCWLAEAKRALVPPEPTNTFGSGTARWEGEQCGDQDCGHSSTFHANKGTGVCTKVDCVCMKFIPTGLANDQAR